MDTEDSASQGEKGLEMCAQFSDIKYTNLKGINTLKKKKKKRQTP